MAFVVAPSEVPNLSLPAALVDTSSALSQANPRRRRGVASLPERARTECCVAGVIAQQSLDLPYNPLANSVRIPV